MFIKINTENPQERLIQKAAAILKQGGIIAYPTDTCYGIGCDILNKKAINRMYMLMQRNKNQPFSFICPDLKNISMYAKVHNYAYKTMRRLLPGPYTFVLEGSKLVPKIMLTRRKTAGIRVPNNNISICLVRELGNPIISTTAKMPDKTVFENPSFIHDYFTDIDLVIDGGIIPERVSSVISLINDIPEIIRKGAGDVSIFE